MRRRRGFEQFRGHSNSALIMSARSANRLGVLSLYDYYKINVNDTLYHNHASPSYSVSLFVHFVEAYPPLNPHRHQGVDFPRIQWKDFIQAGILHHESLIYAKVKVHTFALGVLHHHKQHCHPEKVEQEEPIKQYRRYAP